MLQLRYSSLPVLACGVLVALSACNREGQDEMSWARAALERNSNIEIVTTDPKSRTFTVRDKNGGALHTVRADEVVATPALAAAGSTNSVAPASAAASSAPAASTSAPAATEAASATAAPASTPPDEADSAPAMPTTPSSLAPQNAAAEASGGRVLESGPGYTIKTAAAAASANSATLRDSGVTSAPVERRYEPIVCQGARLLHIDNRNLVFSGNAVSAEDGCEIHITNSHITASGVGVSARAANVHIDNSLIEGDQASIDASEGAQVYAASSHFKGLSRRLDSATFHDLGGNIWN